MDLATFHVLLTPDGQGALAAAAALRPAEATFLRCFEQLRKRHPPALAKAALETVLLRAKARDKFALADRLFLLSPSPTRVMAELPIPHPRSKRTPEELAAFRGQIARKLMGA